jgi:hypothetical protein
MINELQVPLSVEEELLSHSFLVHWFFSDPLGLKHLLLSDFLFLLDLFLGESGVGLPG